MCPTLAITNKIENAIGMFVAVTLVLMLTNLIVSLIRKLIPTEIRLPVYIVIIATFVTCITLFIQAFAYPLYSALGIFLPLITVNCIVLGRAEAFASRNSVGKSVVDGLATGLGFGLGILSIAFVREIFGTGTIALHNVFGDGGEIFNLAKLFGDKFYEFTSSHAISLLQSGMGAFLVFGLLSASVIAIVNHRKEKQNKVKEEVKENA